VWIDGLVVISAGANFMHRAYRYIYSQLRMATDFKKFSCVWRWGVSGC